MANAISGRAYLVMSIGEGDRERPITAPEKAVLVAISDTVGENGIGWMLISTIMEKTMLSKRSVQAAIAALCEVKMLARKERTNRCNIFRVDISLMPTKRPDRSPKEMSEDELIWGAGDAPLPDGGVQEVHGGGAGGARGGRRRCTHNRVEEPCVEPNPPLPSVGPPQGGFELVGEVPLPDLPDYVREQWSKLVQQYPRTEKILVLNDSRRKAIIARAREVRAGTGMPVHQVWDQIFAAIAGDTFLRGESTPGKGYAKAFSLSIDYALRPKQFLRILEKAVTNASDNANSTDPFTGRQYGPAEQSARSALERYLADRAQRG